MARVVPSESVRFTPDQRDALIQAAARLQAEHEANLGAEELARAAREAGIDPRFLGEAVARLDAVSRPAPDARGPLAALVGLAFLDLVILCDQPHWADHPTLSPLKVLFAVGAAFVLATVVARQRVLRWVAPIGVVVAWTALVVAFAVYLRLSGVYGWGWLPKLAFAVGGLQALAALAASGLAAYHDGDRR